MGEGERDIIWYDTQHIEQFIMYNTLMGVEVVTITPLVVYWQHHNYCQMKAGCNGNTPFLTVWGQGLPV